MTDFKVFRAELTGLTPGTDYQFRIGKKSPTYRFRTMPAKATDTIHFISGGDCGVNPHAVANNIQAARQDPMFAVIGGDLGYDNGKSVDVSLAFLRNYSKHMIGRDGRLIPMVAVHRQPRSGRRLQQAARQGPVLLRPVRRPLPRDRLRHARFRRLPQPGAARHRPHHAHRRRPDRLAGEDAQGAGRPPERVRGQPRAGLSVVPQGGGHDGKEGTGEGNRKHWVPLFEKYRVPVVLEHHDHTFKRTKPLLDGLANDNGVLYLGDGSWGRLRTPQTPEKLAYLAASSRDYHLSLHRIQGKERFHLALDEYGR